MITVKSKVKLLRMREITSIVNAEISNVLEIGVIYCQFGLPVINVPMFDAFSFRL